MLFQIVAHVESVGDVAYRNWTHDAQRYRIFDYQARERLATLRLINKSFCYSASVRLFRHIIARPGFNRRLPPLVRLCEISNSPNAIHVRQIDLGYSEIGKSTAELQVYVEDLAGILLPCLHRFPNLRALVFGEPASSLPQEYRQIYINTVTTALLYVPLPNLVELELCFPITHNFRHLFPAGASPLRTPIENILRPLRHLGLFVREYTGTQDQRYYREPVLPEYAALPTDTNSFHLFKMVELATNLESLAIGSTDYLSFDPEPLSQNRLRCLYLNCVSISSDSLLAFIDQSKESIRYIELWQVKMDSGTWQHVLLELCGLPRLLDFVIKSSGYSFTGSSSHLAPGLLPPPDDPQDIETYNYLDNYALGNLQRRVNTNRVAAGFQPFSDFEYSYINRPSLESRLADE
jgi:hypothetical protein